MVSEFINVVKGSNNKRSTEALVNKFNFVLFNVLHVLTAGIIVVRRGDLFFKEVVDLSQSQDLIFFKFVLLVRRAILFWLETHFLVITFLSLLLSLHRLGALLLLCCGLLFLILTLLRCLNNPTASTFFRFNFSSLTWNRFQVN